MGDNYRPVQPLYGRKVPEKSVKMIQAATKIHSYKSKVTASGLGAPLVIKHLSQEEPRVAQHDQWYWSMVSHCHQQWCWYQFWQRGTEDIFDADRRQ